MQNKTTKASPKVITNYSNSTKIKITSQYTNHLTLQAEETIQLQKKEQYTQHEQPHQSMLHKYIETSKTINQQCKSRHKYEHIMCLPTMDNHVTLKLALYRTLNYMYYCGHIKRIHYSFTKTFREFNCNSVSTIYPTKQTSRSIFFYQP